MKLLLAVLLSALTSITFAQSPATPVPSVPATPARLRPPPAGVDLIPDVIYGQSGGQSLHLIMARPKNPPSGPLPAVVYIHGGSWFAGKAREGLPDIYRLAEHGYVGVTVEYRLATDTLHFPAQLEDCKCAIRFLRAKAAEYQIDPHRIGVMGASAGGHLASLVGLTGQSEFEGNGGWADQSSAVQAVVDWFGPTEFFGTKDIEPRYFDPKGGLSKLLGGVFNQVPDQARRASPLAYVQPGKIYPPFLIMQGGQDHTMVPSHSLHLAEALTMAGADVTLRVIAAAGHGGALFEAGDPWSDVMIFLDRNLRASPQATLPPPPR